MPDFQVPIEAIEANKRKILYFAIPLIVLIAVNIVLFLALKYVGNKSSTSSVPPIITSKTSQISPWPYSIDVLNPEPMVPSAEELFKLYQEARQAIKDGNKEDIETKVAKELVWNSENPLKFTGQKKDGLALDIKRNISQEEYFRELSPLMVDPVSIEPLEVVSWSKDYTPISQTILVVDEISGKEQKVVMTNWRYQIQLRVKVKEKPKGEEQKGVIYFVYDRNTWRYFGENWLPSPSIPSE